MFDEMLLILPEGTKDSTTSVVMYRSPRIKYLISMYKQVEALYPAFTYISLKDFFIPSIVLFTLA